MVALAYNVGALRRRFPEPVTPWRQLIKDTKAGHLYCRSSVIRQPGGELDLKTALDFTRQPLAQNPLLAAVIYRYSLTIAHICIFWSTN